MANPANPVAAFPAFPGFSPPGLGLGGMGGMSMGGMGGMDGMGMGGMGGLSNVKRRDDHSMKNRTSICTYPYRIHSLGAWRPNRGPLEYSIPLLGTQITVIVAITQAFNFLFQPLGLPPIFSQILGGILLGDEYVGRFLTKIIKSISNSPVGKLFAHKNAKPETSDYLQKLFPLRGSGPLGNFAVIGFMLFQFLLGVKMDPRMIYHSGKKAAVIGILGLIVPLIVGVCTVPVLEKIFKVEASLRADNGHVEHMFYYIAAEHSMSTFPVIATLLTELKILNSDLGRLALSSSMVSEACNLLLSMVMIHFKKFDASSWSELKFPNANVSLLGTSPDKKSYCKDRVWLCAPLAAAMCVAVVVFVVRPAIKWVIKRSPKDKPMKEIYVISFLAAVLLSGLTSIVIGNHVLFGPFILGLAVPDGPPLGTTLVNKFESLTVCLLVPLFLTISGLRTMFSSLLDLSSRQFLFMPILVVVITIGKIVATMFPCLYLRMPFRDALALGIIMSAKGIVELSTYNVWRDSQVLNDATFTFVVLLVMINAAIVPHLVRFLYDPAKKYAGYVKRTIMHLEAGTELRVVTCINEAENVPTFINLLQASNPTTESPICAYVLHIVELFGRDAPVFISHDDKTRSAYTSDTSQSEHIIKAFKNYEQQNHSTVKVQAFTSISSFSSMHDDICTLALNQRSVLVILPFHKQWTVGGTMDAHGKNNLRSLNKRVLDNAPCSVGILIDRGKNKVTDTMRVGVPFLGGADDREALAYAKRMSENPSVSVTVIRLVAAEEVVAVNESDMMLDKEVLSEFKVSTVANDRVVYKEETVRDGGQTAWRIHSMENEHDLLIVGRRHESQLAILSGLTEWTEHPELGEVGDMLALSDVKAEVSVLVIQQVTVQS